MSSTFGRASLFIHNVTVADDKANEEFNYEVIDSIVDIWRGAIQVQVMGKLESASDRERQYFCETGISSICLNGYASPNRVWDVHS